MKGCLTQSSLDIDDGNNNCINEMELEDDYEEDLRDALRIDENEECFKNYKNEVALMERVWSLSKPPGIIRQLPIVSTRQIQVTRQRLSSTIKKPSNLVETLRDKVEENLKKQKQIK